jgi:hypothetical protein
MACDRCAEFAALLLIKHPSDLSAAIRLAKRGVVERILEEVPAGPMAGNISFRDLRPDGPWDDLVLYRFRCTGCSEAFVLSAETYHGAGGEWKAELPAVIGSVLTLACRRCTKSFPHFIVERDTDASAKGLISASSCEHNEIVVGKLPSGVAQDDEAEIADFERKLGKQFGRSDFRVVRMLRAERAATPGRSFPVFRRNSSRPVATYSCICCGVGEARASRDMTVAEFEASGGRALTIGDVEIDRG